MERKYTTGRVLSLRFDSAPTLEAQCEAPAPGQYSRVVSGIIQHSNTPTDSSLIENIIEAFPLAKHGSCKCGKI